MPELPASKPGTRLLSVRQWHALAQDGVEIPMHIKVHGNSMWPLIRSCRDTVTIVALQRPARVGDVVLFESPDGRRYVLHRVWKVHKGRLCTFGDGCSAPDGWIPEENALGLAITVQRGRHLIELNEGVWLLWAKVWTGIFPVRRCIFALRLFFGRLGRWLTQKKRNIGNGTKAE